MSTDAASQANDVRFLCERPAYVTPVLSEPASAHPLGLGIKNNYTYRVADGSLRLPKSSEGLIDLRATTARSIESLDEIYRPQAWRSILVGPKLFAELPDPLVVAQHFGITPVVDRGETLRALAVGSVVRPPGAVMLADQKWVQEEPVAGVGCLFLVVDRSRITRRAWLRVNWTVTTRRLCLDLEDLHDYGLTMNGRRRHAVLYAAEARTTAVHQRLRRCAVVLGFDLTVVHRGSRDGWESVVQRRPPAIAMAEKTLSVPPEVHKALTAQGKDVHEIPDHSDEMLIEEVRARLTMGAGLTAALTCRPRSAQDAPDDYRVIARTPLPIGQKGQRYKHCRTRFRYEEDVAVQRFFTRDHSNHTQDRENNPVAAKRYRATKYGLLWEADLDENGREIGEDVKHKGDDFKEIPWSDLAAC